MWVLVDGSGSISDRELKQFLGEVYGIAKEARVKVVPWDATYYEVIEARRPGDVVSKVRTGIRGYGGTVIAPVLGFTVKNMRWGDAVVVLTDGVIADAGDVETKRLFAEVAARASVAVFATTCKKIRLPPRWRVVKVEVER